MQILIENIKPNPYRKMDKYPIKREKVESLKHSINQTGFWDNIVVRLLPDIKIDCTNCAERLCLLKHRCIEDKIDGCKQISPVFELAYGHHRLVALQELGIKEIDVPIKELSDITMIQVMANENMNEWGASPDIIIETVAVAKEYLEGIIAEYDSWERLDKSIRPMFGGEKKSGEGNFQKAKKEGVGRKVLKNFLGDNWKEWQIQDALIIINSADKIDVEAIKKEVLNSVGYAKDTVEVLKKHKVKKEDQAGIIKQAVKEVEDLPKQKGVNKNTRLKASVEKAIEDHNYKIHKENFDKVFPKKEKKDSKIDLNEAMETAIKDILNINMNISMQGGFKENWEHIDEELRVKFVKFVKRFFTLLKELEETNKCQKFLLKE